MEINDNGNDEERRIQHSREQNRVAEQRKRAAEPMRTFEAKLSEKASHETALKDAAARESRQQKSDADEHESLIERILGATSKGKEEETATDHARVQKTIYEDGREESRHETDYRRRLTEDKKDVAEGDEKKPASSAGDKKSEVAEDGHRRVVEKQDDGETGSFGGGAGGGGGEGQSEGGSSSHSQGGSGFGSDSRRDGGMFAKDLVKRMALTPIKKGSDAGRGFQQNPRTFAAKDLDEIVSKVEVGVHGGEGDFFSVELTDAYFSGLQVRAVRESDGVVLRFSCPNVAVRSTFLKYRTALVARFKEKGIAVSRIDVV